MSKPGIFGNHFLDDADLSTVSVDASVTNVSNLSVVHIDVNIPDY
jgi:hypothetical protein